MEPPAGSKELLEERMVELEANSALWASDFMTGPNPTLADITSCTSLGFLEGIQYDFSRFVPLKYNVTIVQPRTHLVCNMRMSP